jgi:hypothetical protein
MHNTILETIVASLCQVSPNYHLAPLLLLPPKNTYLLLAPFASPLYSHYCATKYTHHHPFYTSPAPQLYSSLPYSLSPHFRIFCIIYGCPPATSTSPHHIPMLSLLPQPMDDPSPPLASACPPCPHFRFFLHHLGLFLCCQLFSPPFPIV